MEKGKGIIKEEELVPLLDSTKSSVPTSGLVVAVTEPVIEGNRILKRDSSKCCKKSKSGIRNSQKKLEGSSSAGGISEQTEENMTSKEKDVSLVQDSLATETVRNTVQAPNKNGKPGMSSDELVELCLWDPKRARRIISNRDSAARSKAKKEEASLLKTKFEAYQSQISSFQAQMGMMEEKLSALRAENSKWRVTSQYLCSECATKFNPCFRGTGTSMIDQVPIPEYDLQQNLHQQNNQIPSGQGENCKRNDEWLQFINLEKFRDELQDSHNNSPSK